jgi:large subunit ribosomal protein L13
MSFPGKAVQRAWHLVDASSQTVGRLATQVAVLLKGKHKPTYRPNGDCGDIVVIINADKVTFTGNKWNDKLYRWHTGYPGGLKQRTAKDMLERRPTEILRKAVLGMLSRTRLRNTYIEPRLKIYSGPSHPHTAQLPDSVEPILRHPRKLSGDFHFGLQLYSDPNIRQGLLKK